MKKNNINNKKGFTIIEVILVLAIGSLIILMALVALPSLQSSQRDQQRKTDYSMLETAVTNYSSNNRGQLPTAADFWKTYIKDSWADPSAGEYTVEIWETSKTQNQMPTIDKTNKDDTGIIYILKSAKCDGESPKYDATLGARRYAIYAYLESGNYCQAD